MPSSGYIANTFVAGEQPATSKWNQLWSNDSSFNSGNGFNDAILVQRHFSTNSVPALALDTAAITLGYAQITSDFNTTSSSYVDVTNLSVAVTIPTGSRRILIVGFAGGVSASVANASAAFNIFDVTASAQLAESVGSTNASGNNISLIPLASHSPAAGSRTYKIQMKNSGNAATVHTNSAATNPSFIAVLAI